MYATRQNTYFCRSYILHHFLLTVGSLTKCFLKYVDTDWLVDCTCPGESSELQATEFRWTNIQSGGRLGCCSARPLILNFDYTTLFADLEGGKFFFNTVKEGDSVLFATDDEQVLLYILIIYFVLLIKNIWRVQDSQNWVMAFYRATGQAHKPAPPVSTGNSAAAGAGGKAGPGEAGDRKHGMEEFIGADPIVFDHALLFKRLQSFSLEWRLQDSASKSSIRRFVINEKAPARAFSWFKAAITTFTFKNLLRHYAKPK